MSEVVVIVGATMAAVSFGAAAVCSHLVRSGRRRSFLVVFAALVVIEFWLFTHADRMELDGPGLLYALFALWLFGTVLIGMVLGLLHGFWRGVYPAQDPENEGVT